MFSVFYAMYDSLLDIRRVETNVFPLLILKHEFLQRPELKHNKVLKNITKMI